MSLLPDPDTKDRAFTIISVDDHLIEPADLFDGRMPADLADRAPRVVELEGAKQAWVFDDALYPNIGLNAVIGRPKSEWSMDPVRFGIYTTIGCIPWTAALAYAGYAVGANWQSIVNGFRGPTYVIAAVVVIGLAIAIWRYARRRRAERAC